MSTTTTTLIPLLLLLIFFTTTTSARPCKSLFFITSTSYPTLPSNPTPNPNPRYVTLFISSNPNPNRFFLIPKPFSTPLVFNRFAPRMWVKKGPAMAHISNPHVVHRRHRLTNSFSGFDSRGYDPINVHDFDQKTESFSGLEGTLKSRSRVFQQDVDQGSGYFSDIGLGGYGRVKSSMKDRSKDIMSVVGALLFGMGCGALTAATMYLVWSLFAPNRFEFEESDDEEFDGEDDDELYNPKKIGQGGYMVIPSKVVDDQEVKKGVDEDVAKVGA
ncbi:hypothetical protein LIER_08739 [Lithospermum erythrorhizon]|uniref:Transmembrane protein n=1 Tax=Lithospermum erythrorhizon TaxID=34254 RepID=A0AAV3PCZ5_LITER